uniref:Uncharacterized protein n=1 Tax=Arundo donax TaxID=35708 RepID=A0A0A8ZLK0_ARUDO
MFLQSSCLLVGLPLILILDNIPKFFLLCLYTLLYMFLQCSELEHCHFVQGFSVT